MAREPSSRDDIRFIDNFRRLRTELGLRQADVAEKMQSWGWEYFTQTTLSRLEKGERPLRLGEARALAAIVNRPMPELLAPSGNVAAMDLLSRADREGRNAGIKLYEALTSVYIAHHNLGNALAKAEAIDPTALGDDNLALRFKSELKSAKSELRSLEEAMSELSPESRAILAQTHAEFEELNETTELSDGIDL